MKKLLFTALLSVMALSATAAEKTTLRFATEATYPPFEFIDTNNKIQGFDIDLTNAICEKINSECTFTNQAFDSLIPSLKFRRFDALMAGIDITPERQKQVDFTHTYYDNSAIFIAIKGKFSNIADLKNKQIGIQNGTTHQKYLIEQHKEIKTVPYDSYQNAILDLKNGRIDAVFGDTAVVHEWLRKNKELVTIGNKVTDKNYFGTGLGIAVRKGNTELLNKLNKALAEIKQDGSYDTLYKKWFEQ
ncbi:arginine ABC transporter substrate-binding protein [Xenorhabdus nematophila]|uniref:arginine ABC transporter substrate-binding protein n=1 Tax=Xenorhabdus nematophila TaxID=628 RepID=UPI0003275260|nr:arginine ABC transporter substrate-binding protein [Xenorhabdus nematophila]CCW29512.1 putative ABC transporter arginine-binding protein 2 [Xenorhabdus nematophila F1]